MRLSDAQLFAGLGHPNKLVRENVLTAYTQAYRADVRVTRAAISAFETFGWAEAFVWSHRFADCELDEESLLWVLEQISRRDPEGPEESMRYHLAGMLSNAPISVLQKHLDAVLAIDEVNCRNSFYKRSFENWADYIRHRIDVWDRDVDECWEEINEFCEALVEVESFQDAKIPQYEVLLERIAADGQRYEPQVLQLLEDTDPEDTGPRQWLVGLMIILAGKLKIESAVPFLLDKFEIDWDWYHEEINKAVTMIGTESAHGCAAERYFTLPEDARFFLTSILENIRCESGVDHILPVLESEDDDDFRCQLAVALAAQYDQRGVQAANRVFEERPKDPEREAIVERLFAFASLAEIDLPEKEAWGRYLEKTNREFQAKREVVAAQLEQLAKLSSAATGSKSVDQPAQRARGIESATAAAVSTVTNVRTEQRVGRNDQCPCGSGKKYKKCCMRSAGQ